MYFNNVICAVRDRAVVIIIEGSVMVSRSSLLQSTRGFTLVELIVVIVIAAILAVLAAPSFNTFIAKQQTRSAAYDFAQTLQTARSDAILTRRSVDLRASYPTTGNNWNGTKTGTLFSTNLTTSDTSKVANSSYYVLESGTGLNNSASTDNNVTQVSTLNSNVTINSTPVVIRFTSSSAVQISTDKTTFSDLTADQAFTVKYSGSADSGYTVTLNHFGGVQVKKN